jgi:hypothetical protein
MQQRSAVEVGLIRGLQLDWTLGASSCLFRSTHCLYIGGRGRPVCDFGTEVLELVVRRSPSPKFRVPPLSTRRPPGEQLLLGFSFGFGSLKNRANHISIKIDSD